MSANDCNECLQMFTLFLKNLDNECANVADDECAKIMRIIYEYLWTMFEQSFANICEQYSCNHLQSFANNVHDQYTVLSTSSFLNFTVFADVGSSILFISAMN